MTRKLKRQRTEDARKVAEAATALGLREFDFLRLAYRRWFGAQPTEAELEAFFGPYMLHGIVPPWARHLSREVLECRRKGSLGADAFDAHRYRERLARHPRGRMYVAMAAAWLVLFAALLDTRYDPGTSAPMPACAASPAGRLAVIWTHWFAGRAVPSCVPGPETSPPPEVTR